jgi:hypothetical protein
MVRSVGKAVIEETVMLLRYCFAEKGEGGERGWVYISCWAKLRTSPQDANDRVRVGVRERKKHACWLRLAMSRRAYDDEVPIWAKLYSRNGGARGVTALGMANKREGTPLLR